MRLDFAFLMLFGFRADGAFLSDCRLDDLSQNEPAYFQKWDCNAPKASGYV